jgi:hypothetical protein
MSQAREPYGRPEDLSGAIQDRVHKNIGRARKPRTAPLTSPESTQRRFPPQRDAEHIRASEIALTPEMWRYVLHDAA